jgi:hypothetical protein
MAGRVLGYPSQRLKDMKSLNTIFSYKNPF